MTCVANCRDCPDCVDEIRLAEHEADIQQAEAPAKSLNAWGCYCADDENCETCTEFEEEVKTYPHISELRPSRIPVGPEAYAEQQGMFRAFISRRCR